MSTTIDNRVVEMQFDNAQFEKGVQTSLRSLEDLKKGLELDKAVSSLSALEKVANNFDLSGIENAVTSLQQRFSTLGVIGMTALENITNRAVDAGVSMMKSLSIDQIASGMSKYEAETSSVATMRYAIDGGTTEEGTKKIYEAIEKLQSYSDETSYSFSTMVDNMGKFIAAGVDLDKAETSMEGIANWAAKAGTSAQSANFGRVMYNLSQAMGQGVIKVSDWMSVETANMATKDFKQQVIETAAAYGTLTKSGDKYYTKASKGNKSVEVTAENMRTTLAKGWFTADVLTEVLGKYADRTTKFGLEAFKAAQQARTFTDAIEATKDAVSTGWARSFRIIFGDIDQATELFTDMANGMIGVTDMVASFRNSVLKAWAADEGRENLIQGFKNIWDILRGIGREVGLAFGWLYDGTADRYGAKLAELSKGFRDLTEKGLGFFEHYEQAEEDAEKTSTKTTKQITGDLKDISDWSAEAEESVRGMISKQMRPETVEKWNAAADAIHDFNEYVNSGSVDAEVYQQKLANVREQLAGLQKTNKLKKRKQNALKTIIGSTEGFDEASKETKEVTEEVAEEAEESEKTIYYYSLRLRPVIKGFADVIGTFKDILLITGDEFTKFAGKFTPLLSPILGLAGAIGSLASHIRRTGIITETFRGWLQQLSASFSPIVEKVEEVAGWIDALREAIYNKDFSNTSIVDNLDKWTFLNGPIGEKLKNIANGILAAGNIIVRIISAVNSVLSTFFADYILPLVGPVANAALNFLSGIGKILTSLDSGMLSLDNVTAAANRVKEFLASIRDIIAQSRIFQRARIIIGTFFSIFSKSPEVALKYAKSVGRAILATVKSSELYKKATAKIRGFVDGLKATFANSKRLQSAQRWIKNFFTALQKRPKLALKMLQVLGDKMLTMFGESKLIKTLSDFSGRVSKFFTGLFPKKDTVPVLGRAKSLLTSLGQTFQEKGLQGVMDRVVSGIGRRLENLKKSFEQTKVGQALIRLKNGLVSAWNNLKKELGVDGFVERVRGFLDRLAKAYEENGLIGAIDLIRETITKKLDAFKEQLLQNEIIKRILALKDSITAAFKDFGDKVNLTEKIERFKKWWANLKKTFTDKGPITALKKFKDDLVEKISTFTSGLSFASIVAVVKSWFAQLKESIEISGVLARFDELKAAIKEKLLSIFPSPKEVEQEADGSEAGEGLFASLKNRVMEWLASIKEKISSEGIASGIGNAIRKVINVALIAVAAKMVLDIFGFLSGIGSVLKKFSGDTIEDKVDSVSKALKSLAIAVGVIALSIFALSMIPSDKLLNAVTAIVTVLGAIGIMAAGIKALKLEESMKILFKAGVGILSIALGMIFIATAINMFHDMDPETFADGAKKIAVLMTVMGVFMVLVKKFGGSGFEGQWSAILAVAGSMILLAVSMKMLSDLNPGQALQGVLSIGALLLAMAVAMRIMKNNSAGKGSITMVLEYLAFAWAIKGLVDAVRDIGELAPDQWMRGMLGVAALIAGVILVQKLGGKADLKGMVGIVISAMAIAVLMHTLAEQLSKIKDVPMETILAFTLGLSALILSLTGAITLMAAIPIVGILKGVAGISIAILAIGLVLNLVAKLSGDTIQGLSENMFVVGSNLEAFSEMVSNLDTGSINTAIQVMKDFAIAAAEVTLTDTSELMNFMTSMLRVGSSIKLFGLMASNAADVSGSFQLMKDFKAAAVEAMGTDYSPLNSFRQAMVRMGAGLRLYSNLTKDLVSPESDPIKSIAVSMNDAYTSMSGVSDIGDLTTAITHMGAAVRLYYSEIGGITPTDGAVSLSGIAEKFRELVANMPDDGTIKDISAYASGGTNDLANFALGITAIGTAFEEFGKISDNVSEEKVSAATEALERLKTISNQFVGDNAVDLSFFGVLQAHVEPMTSFPEQITLLGTALKDYGEQVGGVNLWKVGLANTVLDQLVNISNKLNGGDEKWGFLSSLTSRKDGLSTFSADVVTLGTALKDYGTNVGSVEISSITAANSAVEKLVEIQDSLTPVGSILDFFKGRKDLGTFGSKISSLGSGLKRFVKAIAGDDGKGIDEAQIKAATDTLDALTKINNALPTTGGLFQLISGGKSLSSFGGDLPKVGEGLNGLFSAFLGEDGKYHMPSDSDREAIIKSLDAFSAINAALTDQNGDSSGLEKLLGIANINNLGNFAGNFGPLGEGLRDFASAFADSGVTVEQVTAAASMVTAFANAAKTLPEETNTAFERFIGLSSIDNLGKFSENFTPLGENLRDFASAFSGVELTDDMVASATGAVGLFSELAKSLPDNQGVIAKFFDGDQSLQAFTGQLPTVGGHLVSFASTVKDLDYGSALSAVSLVRALVGLASDVANNTELANGFDPLTTFMQQVAGWGDESTFMDALAVFTYDFTEALAAKLPAEENKAIIRNALLDLMSITPEDFGGGMSIRPVLDTSGVTPGVNGINDALNGLDSAALTASISAAITFDSIGLSPITEKLDLMNSYLASIINDNATHTTTLSGDISNVYSQVGAVVEAVNGLDLTIDIGQVANAVDSYLGK